MNERISLKPKEYAKKTGHSYSKVLRDIDAELIPVVRIGRSIQIPMWWIDKNFSNPLLFKTKRIDLINENEIFNNSFKSYN